MESYRLKSIVEALVLASEEPLSFSTLMLILEPDGVTKADLETTINEIRSRYNDDQASGFYLCEVAGGYQFRTKPETVEYIQKLNVSKPSKLSQAALETLAIVAYRQPIVRSEIEDIRGVDSGGVLKTLLERNLIKIIGKRDDPGNPLIYGTTSQFLELFNLNSLKELPTMREYEDLEKEHYATKIKETEEEGKPLLDDLKAPLVEKWDSEDEGLIGDLTTSIKKLRKLEKDIFPKPVETIIAVPNAAAAGTTGEDGSAPTSTEDTGTGDQTLTPAG